MSQSPTHTHLLLVILLTTLHIHTVNGSREISCYQCDWNQSSGCKGTGKVNKEYLETNCTVCYKNVIPYQQGLAAAKGQWVN